LTSDLGNSWGGTDSWRLHDAMSNEPANLRSHEAPSSSLDPVTHDYLESTRQEPQFETALNRSPSLNNSQTDVSALKGSALHSTPGNTFSRLKGNPGYTASSVDVSKFKDGLQYVPGQYSSGIKAGYERQKDFHA